MLSSHQNESALIFLKRRFWRVGMPLVSWTIIYTGWRWSNGTHLDWQTVINQPACYHLQYLYYLAGLYLATPILRTFLRNAGKQEVFYFLAMWLLGASILPKVGSLTGFLPPLLFTVTTGFSGYFVLGYVLRDYKVTKTRYLIFSLTAAACLTITIVGTYLLTFNQSNAQLNETLFEYSSPQIVIYSAIIFLAAKTFAVKPTGAGGSIVAKCIEGLSSASFTIYLVHPLFLDSVSAQLRWIFNLEAHRSLLTLGYTFAVAITTLLCSWLFYLVCRMFKVPDFIAP